jgi:hypothetical protein
LQKLDSFHRKLLTINHKEHFCGKGAGLISLKFETKRRFVPVRGRYQKNEKC